MATKEACDICGITFELKILYNIHSWSHVPYEDVPNFCENVTKCSECDMEFVTFHDWKSHATANHSRSQFACLFCSLLYSNLESLTQHVFKSHPRCLNLVTRKAKFTCVLCGLAFSVANALCQHLQTSHGLIALILMDEKIYPESQHATKSTRITSPQTPTKSILRSQNVTNAQINSQAKTRKKVTFCDEFNGETSRSKAFQNVTICENRVLKSQNGNNVQNRVRITSPPPPGVGKVTICDHPDVKVSEKNGGVSPTKCHKYRCGLCGSTFKHGVQLEIHRKQKHKAIIGSLKPKFGCACCNANFYSKKYVRSHIAKHHNIDVTPKKII